MRGSRYVAAWLSATFVVILSPAAMHTAAAQSASMALTVPEIRDCICEEQKIGMLRSQWQDKEGDYNDRQAQVKRLTSQIDQMRASMDPNDTMAQDQLGELIDLRSRVELDIRGKSLPALQQSTNVLNAEVSRYNANCANRTIYKMDDVEARKNLNCPKP